MPCIYLFIYVIFGTSFTGQIVCLGNSLSQILDGTHIRQARSPHQMYRRLCPYGANRESCFYSQLSMFMRLHDSINDPVHMRNIGKRSGGTDSTAPGDGSPLQPLSRYPGLFASDGLGTAQEQSKLMDTPYGRDDIMDAGDSQSKFNAQSFGFSGANRLRDTMKVNVKELLNSLRLRSAQRNSPPWRSMQRQAMPSDDVGRDVSGDNSQYISMPRKRQILCPRGMPRIQCYDKALAFYMQLLSTMGDQK